MLRRSFLKAVIEGLSGLVTATMVIPGLRFLFHTHGRSRKQGEFVRVATLSALPPGEPMRVVIHASRWDAFIHQPPGPIGSVWLVRDLENPDESEVAAASGRKPEEIESATPAVRCWQTICPHLGCGIDFDARRGAFTCPCHASEFDRSGRVRYGPSPRDMDELACRIGERDANGRRWVEVRYEEFKTGVPHRTALA